MAENPGQPKEHRARPSLRRSFVALGTRNYRLFFIGQLISQSGSWMQRTAQAWLVLDLTGSPLALGTVTALQFVPVLLLSIFGGVLADRMRKRDLLLITQSLQMVQALVLGLLVVTGTVQLWHVYVLTALLGVITAADQPARRALASELVGREALGSAVALDSTLFNSARVVGPALGGLAIVAIGVGGCFLLNGVSYLAVLAALALMRPAEFHLPVSGARGSLAGQVGEGLGYVRRTPEVAFLLLLVAILGTFGYNFQVVLALLARYSLDAGALGFGGLNSALGLGSVVGSLLVASQSRPTRRRVVLAGGVFSLLLLLLALSPWYQLTVALLFAQGLSGVAFSTGANTSVQLRAPDALRGRVMSLYGLLFVGTTPLGAALTGLVAERWNVHVALGVNSLLCILGLALGLGYLRFSGARGVAQPRPTAP